MSVCARTGSRRERTPRCPSASCPPRAGREPRGRRRRSRATRTRPRAASDRGCAGRCRARAGKARCAVPNRGNRAFEPGREGLAAGVGACQFHIFRTRGSERESGYALGVVRQLPESYVPDLQDAQLPSLFDRAAAAAAPGLGLAAAQPAVSATASIRFTACTWSSRAERRVGVSSSRSMTSADAIAHRWTSSASWGKGPGSCLSRWCCRGAAGSLGYTRAGAGTGGRARHGALRGAAAQRGGGAGADGAETGPDLDYDVVSLARTRTGREAAS